ncbi:hypothetical protein A2690_01325 [Candidatus Roizmanbacteria bacterium RIFCSPHIGHO2_01_FULL_39_12b]|uniref:Uncharacterized protein n=1 Tax=Candidatus Roizmanbacteria bacterium RIFCSPHIGHO2_01_FULL_39_12b TaxID=1802030 RepID=A0A1F7GAX3_9BACT|nr:MAG: hypothetical protein A2690_01325 [Candidatus Roizmanbacteria bacterium RIFCSPHIGHO2_01_FULL_39_12b]OGK46081.1 MAG: hypothetical protein A3B46_01230 [Candidatus Roizmanbacteria bacterium RIFCSPLOWO2_01_FULL_39_19]
MNNERRSQIVHPDGSITSLRANIASGLDYEELLMRQAREKLPVGWDCNGGTIVGYGGNSVAFRVNDGCEPTIVVWDHNPERRSRSVWISSRTDVDADFSGFTIPQQFAVIMGVNGIPSWIKLAPEVQGATMGDLSSLYLLGDRKALLDYQRFCNQVIKVFLSKGYLPEIRGTTKRIIALTPWLSQNVMISYIDSCLQMVDAEVADHEIWGNAPLKNKLFICAKLTTLFLSKEFARIAAKTIEGKLKLDTIRREKNCRRREYLENFTLGLREIISLLNGAGYDYRIGGGVAIEAVLEERGVLETHWPFRANGSVRDVDVSIFNGDVTKLADIERYVVSRGKVLRGYPVLSLHYPNSDTVTPNRRTFKSRMRRKYLPSETTGLAINDCGVLVFKYGDLQLTLTRDDMKPVTRSLLGVQFPSLPSETLVGFYLIRTGAFKLKDLDKLKSFFEATRVQIPSRYRDFARLIRCRYREKYRNNLIRQWIAELSFGKI